MFSYSSLATLPCFLFIASTFFFHLYSFLFYFCVTFVLLLIVANAHIFAAFPLASLSFASHSFCPPSLSAANFITSSQFFSHLFFSLLLPLCHFFCYPLSKASHASLFPFLLFYFFSLSFFLYVVPASFINFAQCLFLYFSLVPLLCLLHSHCRRLRSLLTCFFFLYFIRGLLPLCLLKTTLVPSTSLSAFMMLSHLT